MSEDGRERVAVHEAGHAVIGYVVGHPFTDVSIVEDEDSFGRCHFEPDPDDFHPDYDTDDGTFERIKGRVISALAGQVAENLLCGADDREHISASHDYRMAADMADYAVGSDRQLEAFLAWLMVTTEEMVAEPEKRRAIEALAAALLERETLTRGEAVPIIHEALGWPALPS